MRYLLHLCWLGLAFTASAGNYQAHAAENLPAHLNTLQKIDTVIGKGREAEVGFTARVHYSGWLYDAKRKAGKAQQFDSSLERKTPFSFTLGGGQVIEGWDQGVRGMRVGGKRTLFIPAELGYGRRGAGTIIPPNADLVFDVELLGLE
ncbi:MAG: FKBP-type peptidyl-prolyl cis-trans isomerase [Methylophilaceae bacterium]|nr:FKBP-type peptidyl-prolyl cis-trans isomerase [Methylophilaceae bacterium]